ncbi:hypothetical protein [Jonesia quinghaiensis]|uniref:hypothetical protein n=1 Tax=Jonesia quinghaiensis TaxID=262806 RepID=UPI0003FCAE98|nr:hypothetical protein [Jonesia quinghaiensis]
MGEQPIAVTPPEEHYGVMTYGTPPVRRDVRTAGAAFLMWALGFFLASRLLEANYNYLYSRYESTPSRGTPSLLWMGLAALLTIAAIIAVLSAIYAFLQRARYDFDRNQEQRRQLTRLVERLDALEQRAAEQAAAQAGERAPQPSGVQESTVAPDGEASPDRD